MATTEIQVSKTDNELLLIAATPDGSSELCHIKSGYHAPVSYTFNPRTILAGGSYSLWMIGINWGGPGEFEVTLTTDGQEQTYSSGPVNLGWAKRVDIEV